MQVDEIFKELRAKLVQQQRDADTADSWASSETPGFEVPRHAKKEHHALAELSRTPWLGLVVTTMAQAMRVGDIQVNGEREDRLWGAWVDNGLNGAQMAMYRAVFTHGNAFSVVTPSEDGRAKIRFKSSRAVAVKYADPADIYPAAALEALGKQGDDERYHLYVPGFTYRVVASSSADAGVVVEEAIPTDLDVVPVTEFFNLKDLDGKTTGEVLPLIPTAKRINKTLYDRNLIQHFNSWRVRWATGLEAPTKQVERTSTVRGIATSKMHEVTDQEALRRQIVELGHDDTLASTSPDTKFGTLEATDLSPILAAFRADVEALAATSQTPVYALTGQLVNLGSDTVAEARAPITQKTSERQEVIGDALLRTLKIAAAVSGWDDLVSEPDLAISWRDLEIRSVSQAADALGKMRQMLDIPAEGLWQMIPGVSSVDIAAWKVMRENEAANDPLALLAGKHHTSVEDSDGGN